MKTNFKTSTASVQELVERFIAIAVAQQNAIDDYQTTRYNRLYDRMEEVESELKSRDGDQRMVLLPLLESRHLQVRLKAAIALLAVAPVRARKTLQGVRDFAMMPQSIDAIIMLKALDDGFYVPD